MVFWPRPPTPDPRAVRAISQRRQQRGSNNQTPTMSGPPPFENWNFEPEPEAVAEFTDARARLIEFLEAQANLIRQQPVRQSLVDAQINLRDKVLPLLDAVSLQSLLMATDAPDDCYVTAQPFGFYDVGVPAACEQLRHIIPLLGMKLLITPKFDLCVHFCLVNLLEDLGF